MSYDLYCYKSVVGIPDLGEAENIINSEDEDGSQTQVERKCMLKIANTILEYNSKFEIFGYEEDNLEKFIQSDEGTSKHIELTSLDDDFAIQITIFSNYLSFSIPYWYSGEKADAVFKKINQYLKITGQVAGYFVYDPQSETVFNPGIADFDGISIYKQIMTEQGQLNSEIVKKPWWKIWG